MNYRIIGFVAAIVMPLSSMASGKIDANPGLWEWTTKVEMAGMPVQMPPVTGTKCITEEDLVPDNLDLGKGCEMIENSITENTVTWKMKCQVGQGESLMTGQISYEKNSAAGTMVMAAQGMEVRSTINGRRVGHCQLAE